MAFSIPLGQLAEKIKADLDTVVRKATFTVFSKVNLKSPVDTGRFRHNWNVSQGTVDTTTTEGTDQTRAAAQIAKVWTLPLGGVTYMANSLPYAARLEHGYSQQAPQGMVKLSAVEFSDSVQRAIQK
jgi:hypothetical protein